MMETTVRHPPFLLDRVNVRILVPVRSADLAMSAAKKEGGNRCIGHEGLAESGRTLPPPA